MEAVPPTVVPEPSGSCIWVDGDADVEAAFRCDVHLLWSGERGSPLLGI